MQIQKRIDGFCEPLSIAILAVCLGVGAFYMFASNKVDSAPEQLAEGMLKTQGVDIDFSAGKKSQAQVPSEADNNK